MRWAYLILGFVVGLVAAQTLKFPVPQGQTTKATVISVTDGDTIKVRVGFGIEEESDGHLRRRKPTTLQEGARKLADLTGVDEATCLKRLEEQQSHYRWIKTTDCPSCELPKFLSPQGQELKLLQGRDLHGLYGEHFAHFHSANTFP